MSAPEVNMETDDSMKRSNTRIWHAAGKLLQERDIRSACKGKWPR